MTHEITQPFVIAHRGLCSVLPENTLEAILASMECADFAELDVMLTKDQQVIVFHDDYLSELTNIDKFPEFTARKRLDHDDDGHERTDFWVEDFTLEDLRVLRVRQRIKPTKRPNIWNWQLGIPTLEELLDRLLEYKEHVSEGRKSGLMIELKKLKSHKNALLVQKVVQLLRNRKLSRKEDQLQQRIPILLASFCEQIVKKAAAECDLPVIQLLDRKQPYNLECIQKVAWAIGITSDHLLHTEYRLIGDCHKHNLKIFYWTLANDTDKLPEGFEHIDQLYNKLIAEGVDGLITEFPGYTQALIRMNNQKVLTAKK